MANDVAKFEERSVTYKPIGQAEEMTITVGMAKNMLATKSKSGQVPDDKTTLEFLMLCKAGGLNPWVRDCYMLGYDGHDGTSWSLITGIQALRKRAEAHGQFDGLERGVIVSHKESAPTPRKGTMVYSGETLHGGWATVYRKDQRTEIFESVALKTYSTGRSRWKADPAGMITKCAEAAALRRAFPVELSGMYSDEEMERTQQDDLTFDVPASPPAKNSKRATRSEITDLLSQQTPVQSPKSKKEQAIEDQDYEAAKAAAEQAELPDDDGAPSDEEMAKAGMTSDGALFDKTPDAVDDSF